MSGEWTNKKSKSRKTKSQGGNRNTHYPTKWCVSVCEDGGARLTLTTCVWGMLPVTRDPEQNLSDKVQVIIKNSVLWYFWRWFQQFLGDFWIISTVIPQVFPVQSMRKHLASTTFCCPSRVVTKEFEVYTKLLRWRVLLPPPRVKCCLSVFRPLGLLPQLIIFPELVRCSILDFLGCQFPDRLPLYFLTVNLSFSVSVTARKFRLVPHVHKDSQ